MIALLLCKQLKTKISCILKSIAPKERRGEAKIGVCKEEN